MKSMIGSSVPSVTGIPGRPPLRAASVCDVSRDREERDEYYGNLVDSRDRDALFQGLHQLLDSSQTFSADYTTTLRLVPWINTHADGKVHCLYTGGTFGLPEPTEPVEIRKLSSSDPTWTRRWIELVAAASMSAETVGAATALHYPFPYAVEHIVPQSWFHRSRPMRSDLHILVPVEQYANSARGNLKFGSVPHTDVNRVDGGWACGDRFEPECGKGEAARNTLYFLLRYPGLLGDGPAHYTRADLATLVAWHRSHPVSEHERRRNAINYHIQGNRNPLVDFPDLVDRLDFERGLRAPGQPEPSYLTPLARSKQQGAAP